MSAQVPEFSRFEATVAASEIFMAKATRVMNDSAYTSRSIRDAICPFFALDFTRELILRVGLNCWNHFLARVRGSRLPKVHFRAFVAHVKVYLLDDSLAFPADWEDWRLMIVTNNLAEQISMPDWVPIINHLAASLILHPSDFLKWSFAEISTVAISSPEATSILALYQASLVTLRSASSATPAASWKVMSSAHSLAEALRVPSVAQTEFALQHEVALAELDVREDYFKLGPAARIRALSESTAPRHDILRFLNTGAQVNVLHQVQDSLRPVASGIQCYASFCDLLNVVYFPPVAETVLRWSTVFSPGRTFAQYISHLAKACQLLNLPNSWLTPAVRAVSRGLANAQDLSFRFDNFIQRDLFVRMMNFESLRTETGRLFYIAYLFLLRVPSEGLPCIRAEATDILTTKSPQVHQAILGCRMIGEEPRLILKLKRRKLNKAGAIMMRPCFCDSRNAMVPSGLCPIHDFWPLVQKNNLPGERLFSSLTSKNLNRVLKGVLASMQIPNAHAYSTKAFRRGAAMDIMSSGSTLAQIMRSAGWSSQAFRAYLVFQMEEECNMKAIFAGSSHSDRDSKAKRKKRNDKTAPKLTAAVLECLSVHSSSIPSTSSSDGT